VDGRVAHGPPHDVAIDQAQQLARHGPLIEQAPPKRPTRGYANATYACSALDE
jgi:hypothetical protein